MVATLVTASLKSTPVLFYSVVNFYCLFWELLIGFELVDVIVEFYAGKVQIFQLLQCWSYIRCPYDSIQTHVVQEDARQGKTLRFYG